MAFCDICGKGTVTGRSHRHKATGRWATRAPETPRKFRPNLQKSIVDLGGERVHLTVCTRCLRTLAKQTEAQVKA